MSKQLRIRESAENYLKAIYILRDRLGEVRSVDVATELGVSKPSVSVAVKKLRNDGLVNMDENHYLLLTKEGLEYAAYIFGRHVILEEFFTDVLEIDKKTAHNDSCRLEHIVSSEMLSKIKCMNDEKHNSQ